MKPTRSPTVARPLMKLETSEPQVLRRRHRCRLLPLKTNHADSLDLPGRRAWIQPTSHRDSSSRWTCRRRGLNQEGRHRGRCQDRLAVSETSRMPLSSRIALARDVASSQDKPRMSISFPRFFLPRCPSSCTAPIVRPTLCLSLGGGVVYST